MVRNEKWSDGRIENAHPTIDRAEESNTYGEHFSREPEPPIRNPVIEAICNRRSIRLFKPDPIPDEVLWTVLEAARWAPTGEDVQPCYTVVIRDAQKRRRMNELVQLSERRGTLQARIPREHTQFADRFTHASERRVQSLQEALQRPAEGRRRGRFDAAAWEAPVQLVVVGQKFNCGTMECDVDFALENMLVAAVSLGLGSVILGAPRQVPGTSAGDPVRMMYDLLKIPVNDYRISAWVCMGYPAQSPRSRPRFFMQDKVFFDEWGNWDEMPHPEHPARYMVFPEYATF